MAFDLSPMPEGSVVADAVNVPLVTPLLAAAEQRGFRTSNGLEMLLRQAVRGFQLWFGVRPEVTDELRQLIAADIPPR
jgi:shikimate dehydrogenase